MSTKKFPYGTMEVENNTDIIVQKHRFVYKNQPVTKPFMIFQIISFIISIMLLIVCFIPPLTGLFLLYVVILFLISFDTIITVLICKNGICCKSPNNRLNICYDICIIITTCLWILSLFITIICCINDTASKYTSWNRWEEFVPIIIAILIIILLFQKLLIRINSNKLPFIYNTNYTYYNHNILLNSSTYIYCLLPFTLLFFILFMILAITTSIHSIQKSYFINTFNERNTQILTTSNYGTFEYQCIGTINPINATNKIISIGGLSTVHLSFGWYNNLIYNEYGLIQNKSITICDYNRGGYGFTETKNYRDKTIESEVKHLMEIADVLFGVNESFHLMGHSRASLILLQSKILYAERIESIVIFDGVSNANKIQYDALTWTDRQFDTSNTIFGLTYQLYSIGMALITNGITTNIVVQMAMVSEKNKMYEAELNGKYYSLRNYQFQSIIWEGKDMGKGWQNTMKLYNNTQNVILDPVLNIECNDKYNETIQYSTINNTLYVKTGHNPCVLDEEIANMIFNYDNNGLKVFYDSLLL
eukprot:306542_1